MKTCLRSVIRILPCGLMILVYSSIFAQSDAHQASTEIKRPTVGFGVDVQYGISGYNTSYNRTNFTTSLGAVFRYNFQVAKLRVMSSPADVMTFQTDAQFESAFLYGLSTYDSHLLVYGMLGPAYINHFGAGAELIDTTGTGQNANYFYHNEVKHDVKLGLGYEIAIGYTTLPSSESPISFGLGFSIAGNTGMTNPAFLLALRISYWTSISKPE